MEKKTSKNILLIIMGVLIVVEFIVGVMTIPENGNLLISLISLTPLCFVALYGFWLYKKPHGNMLKYAMLLMAASQILISIIDIKDGLNVVNHTIRIFAATILIYVAGRLNRIDQNKFLLPIAFLILFVRKIVVVIEGSGSYSPLTLFAWFDGVIAIFTLMIAYFVRYEEHKEAGLMDAPKE